MFFKHSTIVRECFIWTDLSSQASAESGNSPMFGLMKNRVYPIGVDLSGEGIKLAQLADGTSGPRLVCGKQIDCPDEITAGTAQWQKWAIATIRQATSNGSFKGKEVVGIIPANEVFVENVRLPKNNDQPIENYILMKVKSKLGFDASKESAMIKYIQTSPENLLVMVTERNLINRHLAIYEKAGLSLKAINVWPVALATCYGVFFGRRRSDAESIVMLLDIERDIANLVIARHSVPLYASSIPIGAKQLSDDKVLTRLVVELTSCRRNFSSIYRNAQIERLLFISGGAIDPEIYKMIARQIEVQAQMGDCLAAVELADPQTNGLDRRNATMSWAMAFGLSMS